MSLSSTSRRAAAALVLLAALAGAQDAPRWPAPPDGWWRSLQGGERATYAVSQGPRTCRRTLAVDAVDGSRITISDEQREGEAPPRRQSTTIDVADPLDVGDLTLPEGAHFTRTGQERVRVG